MANCTSDHVSGSFYTTLSLSQLEDLTSYSMPASDVKGFMFSDGNGVHLSDANATLSQLAVTTDSSGNIDWWVLSLRGADGSFLFTSSCLTSTCPGGGTGGLDGSGTSEMDSGSTIFEPFGQHWSAPQSTDALIPEASGGFLVGTGLLLLANFGLFRRHFQRDKLLQA
ncbi:MAG TPA: hypothetical protein VH351_18665 [Bryobacteraceae bacterium]|nr:hypothetical protein [Bryobacteraceae bacterium]